MLKFIASAFLVLHAFVHLLYFGQSWRLFELRPKMIWPQGSWAFSKLLGDEAIRLLASISCILAAIGFVAGGVAIFAGYPWWRSVVACGAVFSAAAYILFWDGRMKKLDDQGGIGLLIDIAILLAVLILRWPDFKF